MKAKKPSKTQFQQFEIVTMRRSDLKEAPFNPRDLDERSQKKLRDNLKKVGLLEPLIVNKRTGHVVGGHKRLESLDAIERSQDYSMEVALVDLDEKAEKEQLVFLNNELAMGAFDAPKLGELLKVADFRDCGFEPFEVESIVPNWQRPPEPEPVKQEDLDVVLVFKDRADNDAFMELINMTSTDKYIVGELIAALLDKAQGAGSAAS
jgi:hypothetical protein